MESDDVIFKVLINQMIVRANIDIVKERNGNIIPRYRDYMVMMRGNKKEGKRDLLISLQSYDELIDGHGLLAGFEIFKLSNPDNSLAIPIPFLPAQDSLFLFSILGHRNSIATLAITIITLINIIVHKVREIWEASSAEEKNKPSARAEQFCRRSLLDEIKLATENFNDAHLIGKGGFGRVYKGLIDKGQKTVAVKRLKLSSNQGSHEFLTEIEMLSELRHVNLVSLIGYCNEHGEMILVYEYMACGTLAGHLYKLQRENEPYCSLTWKQRLHICIGAGRGLDYLHTGHGFIHRDVKTSNILLDKNIVAKVSDFGLAKPEDRNKSKSYISTKVKGTPGYLDPYYFNTHKLARKSDTFAFGVVLLEVLCGRPALDSSVAPNEHILSKWAQDNIGKGEVAQIVAPSLREEISQDSLKTFVGIAERCLCDEPKNRPTMSQVVLQLESALEQEESTKFTAPNHTTSVADNICPTTEETILSVGTKKPTVASTCVQAVTSPPTEQTNRKMDNTDPPAGKKYRGKPKTYKRLLFRKWDAFWNRVKPSKKREPGLVPAICEADITVRKFDLATIAAAMNQFSSSQMIGRGGFGSVYKAVLSTGQMVAVKRFSSLSLHFNQFKSEIVLLSNLHHRNIVKLLGYCIHKEEGMLLYEFMENKSLDTYIFGEQHQLQWSARFRIILGVARGLIYLHQDLGFRIIYGDLKPSNVLLDNEMNPKISGFGIAKSFEDDKSELETIVAGTLGYISPECFIQGKLSDKSDVYSFGVVVLEILSGKRYRFADVNLIEYAWNLQNKGKALDLVEESIREAFSEDEALRCIQVGLLCTQHEPHDRPTLPLVIKMLLGEDSPLQEKIAEAAQYKVRP